MLKEIDKNISFLEFRYHTLVIGQAILRAEVRGRALGQGVRGQEYTHNQQLWVCALARLAWMGFCCPQWVAPRGTIKQKDNETFFVSPAQIKVLLHTAGTQCSLDLSVKGPTRA